MSKINEFRTELFQRLPVGAINQVYVFETAKITSLGKPWMRTFLTDSDQGPIAVYLISEQCYDDKWKETILIGIERSVLSKRVISLNEAGGNTFEEQISKADSTPTVAKKRRSRPAKGKVEAPKKRGRPKKKQ